MILVSLAVLEFARQDVQITRLNVGQTPVTSYIDASTDGPIVVIAHGFAGSQQMMQGYALPLARAGYQVFAFEFLGHGRHPVPMSGDVSSVDGTTRLLVEQTAKVIDALVPRGQSVSLVGHSMATDILVRVAATRSDVDAVALISAFSQVIDATTPDNLLLVTGAWEPGLRAFGVAALQMVDPDAAEGEVASNGDVTRRAVAAPFAEHVSVLHSRAGRKAVVDWLDQTYERVSDVRILPSGWAILGLLAGLVLIFRHIVSFVPKRQASPLTLSQKQIATLLLVPAVVAPLIAVPLNPGFLPVLVADYLGLHLLIYGGLQLVLLKVWGVTFGRIHWAAFGVLLAWCAVFGFALDRYAANFWPTHDRFWIMGVMLIGALPYMVADARLTSSTPFMKRFGVRLSFLISLGIAVALDFEGLFFLIMIAPVLVLFYLVFGTMGRNTSKRGGPLSSGIALGIVLAWALGVSFPLFQA
jgi:pimeloyl-ACP methyl ester carboxylesterase